MKITVINRWGESVTATTGELIFFKADGKEGHGVVEVIRCYDYLDPDTGYVVELKTGNIVELAYCWNED